MCLDLELASHEVVAYTILDDSDATINYNLSRSSIQVSVFVSIDVVYTSCAVIRYAYVHFVVGVVFVERIAEGLRGALGFAATA